MLLTHRTVSLVILHVRVHVGPLISTMIVIEWNIEHVVVLGIHTQTFILILLILII
jgi:hypothetical protein